MTVIGVDVFEEFGSTEHKVGEVLFVLDWVYNNLEGVVIIFGVRQYLMLVNFCLKYSGLNCHSADKFHAIVCNKACRPFFCFLKSD